LTIKLNFYFKFKTMKKLTFITISLCLSLIFPNNIKAENFEDLNKLLQTKQCENCDLSDAGLAMSDLKGANLRGANLVGADLSRANLTGADLSGANLSNASFFGSNLSGANLSGAIVNNTDFRDSYVEGVTLENVDFSRAHVQGAVGIPATAATAEQFYLWAMTADKEGNYPQAMRFYTRAIELNADLAPAYLARGVIKSRYGDAKNAIKDAEKAQELFEAQDNADGYLLSARFVQLVQARTEYDEKQEKNQGSPALVQAVSTVAPLLFRLFSPF
jgi:uncharacterized protein YjbI with pentapeptide repeats